MRGADAGPPGPTPSASSPSRGGSRRGDFHWSEYRRSVENFVNSGEALRASADQFASLKDTYRRPLASMTHSMAADAQAYANENEQFRNGFVSRSLDDQERMRNFIKASLGEAPAIVAGDEENESSMSAPLSSSATTRVFVSKRKRARKRFSKSFQTTLPPLQHFATNYRHGFTMVYDTLRNPVSPQGLGPMGQNVTSTALTVKTASRHAATGGLYAGR